MLLKRFVVSGVDWAEGREDPFEHLSGVVVNATQVHNDIGIDAFMHP